MAGTSGKKRRGRPPQKEGAAKRFPLNMRTTARLRDDIESAARESGRSMSQEVEFRLERSLRDSEHEDQFRKFLKNLYGEPFLHLTEIIADVMHKVGTSCAMFDDASKVNKWWSLPWAYDEAVKAVLVVLEACRPAGPVAGLTMRSSPDNPEALSMGAYYAQEKLDSIVRESSPFGAEERAQLDGLLEQIIANEKVWNSRKRGPS